MRTCGEAAAHLCNPVRSHGAKVGSSVAHNGRSFKFEVANNRSVVALSAPRTPPCCYIRPQCIPLPHWIPIPHICSFRHQVHHRCSASLTQPLPAAGSGCRAAKTKQSKRRRQRRVRARRWRKWARSCQQQMTVALVMRAVTAST